MTYNNPIILCDYSDPDVIRVGSTYFMTASSFNFTPGLPVLTSNDLVHWTLVNYAAPSIPLKGYEYPQNAHGIWAPSLRYHDGEFYIFAGTPDEGLFYTKTRDPYGAWTPLTPVWEGKGFEDPCPLWDDDGRLYVVHGYVKSRIGFNSKLGLLELDPKTMKVKGWCGNGPADRGAGPADRGTGAGRGGSEGGTGSGGIEIAPGVGAGSCASDFVSDGGFADRFIFDGTKTQPTIEGPKFYKRNGWYYIFAPAGGVTQGWQTVLRSRTVTGPYEERIVLAQGSTGINGPHQGGLVDTPSGENWFIHFQDRGIFGRICHLQPVIWEYDWPRMGSAVKDRELAVGEPVTEWTVPDCGGESPETAPATSDSICANPDSVSEPSESVSSRPGSISERPDSVPACAVAGAALEWQWSANGRKDFARLTAPHTLELSVLDTSKAGSPTTESNTSSGPFHIPAIWESANVLTQKISSESFTFSAVFDFSAMKEPSRSGMVFLGDDYASAAVERTEEGFFLVYLESQNPGGDDKRTELVRERLPLSAADVSSVRISLSFSATSASTGKVSFSVEVPASRPWHSPSYETKNAHWVGGRFGVYALGSGGAVKVCSNLF